MPRSVSSCSSPEPKSLKLKEESDTGFNRYRSSRYSSSFRPGGFEFKVESEEELRRKQAHLRGRVKTEDRKPYPTGVKIKQEEVAREEFHKFEPKRYVRGFYQRIRECIRDFSQGKTSVAKLISKLKECPKGCPPYRLDCAHITRIGVGLRRCESSPESEALIAVVTEQIKARNLSAQELAMVVYGLQNQGVSKASRMLIKVCMEHLEKDAHFSFQEFCLILEGLKDFKPSALTKELLKLPLGERVGKAPLLEKAPLLKTLLCLKKRRQKYAHEGDDKYLMDSILKMEQFKAYDRLKVDIDKMIISLLSVPEKRATYDFHGADHKWARHLTKLLVIKRLPSEGQICIITGKGHHAPENWRKMFELVKQAAEEIRGVKCEQDPRNSGRCWVKIS